MHLGSMFPDKETELQNLKARLADMKREREALGQIDSVQLTDLDVDRMAELDDLIIEFTERVQELEPELEAKGYQEQNIQDLGDTIQ